MIDIAIERPFCQRQQLYNKFADKLDVAYHLNRQLVSFQANKSERCYRWFRYKEAFSSTLVKHFLQAYSPAHGKLLDPFAGAGTSLFAAQELGWQATGIELLPVGIFAMQAREVACNVSADELRRQVDTFFRHEKTHAPLSDAVPSFFRHIPITRGAFSEETESRLDCFLHFCEGVNDANVKTLLRFAAFAIMEDVSFTRKDGQYLRWDYRCNRNLQGKPFDKGAILSFEHAIKAKFEQILADIAPTTSRDLFERDNIPTVSVLHPLSIIECSCLQKLGQLKDDTFDFVITSPPYCNRYDYTRTYALELVFLGRSAEEVSRLRQEMLSCTVENRTKTSVLRDWFMGIGRSKDFERVMSVVRSSPAMSEVEEILDGMNRDKVLNNPNVPRMVKNYLLEMCLVISELSRVTKRGGYCVMVNDNVRYGGEEIPIDLILSDFAEQVGWTVEKIFALPKGKGNSSQQMGQFGRAEIRKGVYLWQKK